MYVSVCDIESSTTRGTRPQLGCCFTGKKGKQTCNNGERLSTRIVIVKFHCKITDLRFRFYLPSVVCIITCGKNPDICDNYTKQQSKVKFSRF